MKEDLTEYSDSELSLRVFNDEGLYRMRRSRDFIDTLKEFFIFSDEQEEELKTDLEEDEA